MRTLLLTLGLCSITLAHAQMGTEALSPERKQEIQAQRVAFLTQRMALTPEEAQVFWPVYNSYEQELETLRKAQPNGRRGTMASDEWSEEQARTMLFEELAFDRKMLDLRERYYERFIQAIGARKTMTMQHAEREFHREIFKRVRNERSGKGPGRGGKEQRPAPERKI